MISSRADRKREGRVQPVFGGKGRSRETRVRYHVCNPRRLTARPHPARPADAASKGDRTCGFGKFRDLQRRQMPHVHAAQHAGRLIHAPEIAEVPAQAPSNGAHDFSRRLAQMARLGERMRHGVLSILARLGLAVRFFGTFVVRNILTKPS